MRAIVSWLLGTGPPLTAGPPAATAATSPAAERWAWVAGEAGLAGQRATTPEATAAVAAAEPAIALATRDFLPVRAGSRPIRRAGAEESGGAVGVSGVWAGWDSWVKLVKRCPRSALYFAHASTLGTARPAGELTSWPRRADVKRVRATVLLSGSHHARRVLPRFHPEWKRRRSQAERHLSPYDISHSPTRFMSGLRPRVPITRLARRLTGFPLTGGYKSPGQYQPCASQKPQAPHGVPYRPLI